MGTATQQPVTIERLERGLALLAFLVVRDGEVYAPLFEKLERDIEVMRARQDTVGRARQMMENYKVVGGMKAIR